MKKRNLFAELRAGFNALTAKRLEALLPLVEAYKRRRFPMKIKLRRAARREHG